MFSQNGEPIMTQPRTIPMLRIKCPSCLHNLELPEPEGDTPLTCPDCQSLFDRTGRPIAPIPVPSPNYPVVAGGPRAIAPYSRDLEDYEADKQERRERRQDRHDDRDFRRDKREYLRDEM